MMADTVAVHYRTLGVQTMRGTGSLVALANVEVDVAGVILVLQGVRVLRDARGALTVAAPAFRDGAGVFRSAIVLPDALRNALGAEVLANL